jgi:hypothetical protein
MVWRRVCCSGATFAIDFGSARIVAVHVEDFLVLK